MLSGGSIGKEGGASGSTVSVSTSAIHRSRSRTRTTRRTWAGRRSASAPSWTGLFSSPPAAVPLGEADRRPPPAELKGALDCRRKEPGGADDKSQVLPMGLLVLCISCALSSLSSVCLFSLLFRPHLSLFLRPVLATCLAGQSHHRTPAVPLMAAAAAAVLGRRSVRTRRRPRSKTCSASSSASTWSTRGTTAPSRRSTRATARCESSPTAQSAALFLPGRFRKKRLWWWCRYFCEFTLKFFRTENGLLRHMGRCVGGGDDATYPRLAGAGGGTSCRRQGVRWGVKMGRWNGEAEWRYQWQAEAESDRDHQVPSTHASLTGQDASGCGVRTDRFRC